MTVPASPYEPMALNLKTERLTMRPFTVADAEQLRLLQGERGDGLPPLDRVREFLGRGPERIAENGFALLVMERREEGDFIGYCGLIVGRSTVEEPEIAYELFQRVHNNGYATEAARAVLDAAVATGRERLWSTVRMWNAPSLRVLEKIGFARDHVTEDERGEIVWLTKLLQVAA
ncbi:MAG TPA: GNAT family N-acetyltransferase [Actinospica sp.]|nr:GNAT family N-acetyltransferase [Actinospica sp.]